MHRKIVCFLLTVTVILSSSLIQSSENQLEEKWSVEFDRYYKGNRLHSIESFGLDEKQNILLQIACSYNIYYCKYDTRGNEIVSIPKSTEDFWSDPIMDEEGNIYTYMPWAENEFNCTYIKFDTNMTFVRKIKIDSPYAHASKISNQGNIYLALDKEISVEGVKYTNTTICSFNQTGYLDWSLKFQTKNTQIRTRSGPFLDWKFTENRNGDLFIGFLDNLIKINTTNKSVIWKRKLSQEIHTISVYEKGVNVIYTNYTHGPVIWSQISFDNRLINNFTVGTRALYDYYYSFSFNGKYHIVKTTRRRESEECKLKIFSEIGTKLYEEIYEKNSDIFKLYGLKIPTTEFYTLETFYDSSIDVAKYYLKLYSFEDFVQKTFILSQGFWQLVVISVIMLILYRRKLFKAKTMQENNTSF